MQFISFTVGFFQLACEVRFAYTFPSSIEFM